MARIKKSLKEMFDACQSYGDIFKTMGEAKKLGYSTDEVNMAASYRKNSFARESSSNYKIISSTIFNTDVTKQFMTTNVQVKDLTSNRMSFDGVIFTL